MSIEITAICLFSSFTKKQQILAIFQFSWIFYKDIKILTFQSVYFARKFYTQIKNFKKENTASIFVVNFWQDWFFLQTVILVLDVALSWTIFQKK